MFFCNFAAHPWLPCGFAMVHQAHDLGIISREHYDWWYDGPIRDNIRETGWGAYPLPETIGRERRIDSRIKNEK